MDRGIGNVDRLRTMLWNRALYFLRTVQRRQYLFSIYFSRSYKMIFMSNDDSPSTISEGKESPRLQREQGIMPVILLKQTAIYVKPISQKPELCLSKTRHLCNFSTDNGTQDATSDEGQK